jgi:site-specific DNA-cytosine methylase
LILSDLSHRCLSSGDCDLFTAVLHFLCYSFIHPIHSTTSTLPTTPDSRPSFFLFLFDTMEASLVRFRALVRGMEADEAIRGRYEPRMSQGSYGNEIQVSDEQALAQLVPNRLQSYGHDCNYIVVNNFVVYDQHQLTGKGYGGQLRSLFTESTEKKPALLSGTLQDANISLDCHDMIINELTLDGLLDRSAPSTTIFIDTQASLKRGIRYQLGDPAPNYTPIFKDFKWVADFSKYVLHFLLASSTETISITLNDFRQQFWDFLVQYYDNDDCGLMSLTAWWDQCNYAKDFRTHLARYGQFIYRICRSSAYGDHTINDLLRHSIWDDIAEAEKQARPAESALKDERTAVTVDIGSSFTKTFPLWGTGEFNLLDTVRPNPEIMAARSARMHIFDNRESRAGAAVSAQDLLGNASSLADFGIQFGLEVLGTVLVVRHYGETRLAYARAESKGSSRTLEVIWLARPQDTICGSPEADGTHYWAENELFFLNECNCDPIPSRNVVASYPCEVFTVSQQNLFIKGLYRRDALEHVTADGSLLEQGYCPTHSQVSSNSEGSELVNMNLDSASASIKTMGLFCGCGTLDHSLGFDTVLAVDVNAAALASHKANNPNKNCAYHLQSTNTLLKDIANGKVPYPDPDLIVAGCPCKGFSNCNQHKENVQAHRNCSMLANTLSFVDLLRPKYVLIENVPAMNKSDLAKGRANACKQAVCELKRMDYQVAFHTLRGTDVNGPSIRKRLFIVAAAPNLKLPKKPFMPAHDITAGLVLSDITQKVSNDTILNVKRPDHVPFERLQNDFDAQISLVDVVSRIPRDGPANRRNLYGANSTGALSDHQSHWFRRQTNEKQQPSSKSLQRLHPERPFPTITSTIVPMNSRGSECIHPEQDRTVTMLELRRGQGIPDDFILIGTIKQAREQIGNGVVWQVGQAWGKSIAKAWIESGLGPASLTPPRGNSAAGFSSAASTVARDDRGTRASGTDTLAHASGSRLGVRSLFDTIRSYGGTSRYGASTGYNTNPGYDTRSGYDTHPNHNARSGSDSKFGYGEQSGYGTKSSNNTRPANGTTATLGMGITDTPRPVSTTINTRRAGRTDYFNGPDITHQPGSRKRRRSIVEVSSDSDD